MQTNTVGAMELVEVKPPLRGKPLEWTPANRASRRRQEQQAKRDARRIARLRAASAGGHGVVEAGQ